MEGSPRLVAELVGEARVTSPNGSETENLEEYKCDFKKRVLEFLKFSTKVEFLKVPALSF